jgi:hypothetical protein
VREKEDLTTASVNEMRRLSDAKKIADRASFSSGSA